MEYPLCTPSALTSLIPRVAQEVLSLSSSSDPYCLLSMDETMDWFKTIN